MIMGAYLQAGMIAGALSVNPNGKVPDGQSPQNIEFVKTHRAELDRMFKEAGMISN
jgi:hypothetical protein